MMTTAFETPESLVAAFKSEQIAAIPEGNLAIAFSVKGMFEAAGFLPFIYFLSNVSDDQARHQNLTVATGGEISTGGGRLFDVPMRGLEDDLNNRLSQGTPVLIVFRAQRLRDLPIHREVIRDFVERGGRVVLVGDNLSALDDKTG